MPTRFLWDHRPGNNVDHITAHGLTTDQWETVFHHVTRRITDKDDAEVITAEGRVRGRLFRIVYAIDDEVVVPLTVLPITGFPIRRRGLR